AGRSLPLARVRGRSLTLAQVRGARSMTWATMSACCACAVAPIADVAMDARKDDAGFRIDKVRLVSSPLNSHANSEGARRRGATWVSVHPPMRGPRLESDDRSGDTGSYCIDQEAAAPPARHLERASVAPVQCRHSSGPSAEIPRVAIATDDRSGRRSPRHDRDYRVRAR